MSDVTDFLNIKVPMPVSAKQKPNNNDFEEIEIEDIDLSGEAGGNDLKDKFSTLFPNIEGKAINELDDMLKGRSGGAVDDDGDERLELKDLNGDGDPSTGGEPILSYEEQAELLLELWTEARRAGHAFAWRKLIDPKQARLIYNILVRRNPLSAEEHEIKVKLHDYLEGVEQQRVEYLNSVPYSEGVKKAANKVIQVLLPKMVGSEKMGIWTIILIVFVLPEVILALKLFNISQSLPKLDDGFMERAAAAASQEVKMNTVPKAMQHNG